jgi:hypothetical protein
MIAEHETLAAGKPHQPMLAMLENPGQLPAESPKYAILRVTPPTWVSARRNASDQVEEDEKQSPSRTLKGKPTWNSRDIAKIRYEMHANHMDQSPNTNHHHSGRLWNAWLSMASMAPFRYR